MAPEDCYAVARKLFLGDSLLNVDPRNITLIGDSAGGNLAAAVSLMARDRGEFLPGRQILIYPATASDHTENSPFESIRTNGFDYLLTSKRVEDMIQLYKGSEADLKNPYFAPLEAADLSRQPRTLVITAEYCPLRDEGEFYGKKLEAAGNQVEVYRMHDAFHAYMMLPPRFVHVKKTYELINSFIA
jgi:acetyl esterase/lipase